ncbi:MAG: glycine cleavage system protein GcvH [Fidelibacterota bacterium]|jgi:glycine cleavage system H protein|tara:strand:+ start:1738 stop:2115 length:378 start_codon:yes stop_codon:yes gene_type:complete
MKTPDNLLYTKEHEWADFKGDEVIIGITDYAQNQLGDVIFLEFPQVGDLINEGDVFGEVEAVKTVSELFSPLTGKVVAINETLEDSPDSVNSDPYGLGWLIKISPSKLEEKEALMSSEEYEKLIG